MKCPECELPLKDCACDNVDAHMDFHAQVLENFRKKQRDKKVKDVGGCLSCYFAPCQCAKGLKIKNDKASR